MEIPNIELQGGNIELKGGNTKYRTYVNRYSLDLHLEVFSFVATLAGIEPRPSVLVVLPLAIMPNETSLNIWCSLTTT